MPEVWWRLCFLHKGWLLFNLPRRAPSWYTSVYGLSARDIHWWWLLYSLLLSNTRMRYMRRSKPEDMPWMRQHFLVDARFRLHLLARLILQYYWSELLGVRSRLHLIWQWMCLVDLWCRILPCGVWRLKSMRVLPGELLALRRWNKLLDMRWRLRIRRDLVSQV